MYFKKTILTAAALLPLPMMALAQSEIDQDQLGELVGDVDVEQAQVTGTDAFEGDAGMAQPVGDTAGDTAAGMGADMIDAEQVAAAGGDVAAPDARRGGRVAYVWANNPTAASYVPSSAYAYNPGGAIRISRTGQGTYSVRFAGLGGPKAGGNVQVTGYGSDPADCKIRHWSSGGRDFIATIRCYAANGALMDARYTVLVTRR